MFFSLAAYIGLRYTRAKRRNHFISFISLVSMLGIALGVAILITVLSVMNGFDYQIRSHIFNSTNQVTVSDAGGVLSNWQAVQSKVAKAEDVKAVAPFVVGQGMLSNKGVVQGVMVSGILPKSEAKVSNIAESLAAGSLTSLKPGGFGVVLGQQLADNLNVNIGDKVVLLTPKTNSSPIGVLPRFRRFEVVGILKESGGALSSGVVYINLNDAQKLFEFGSGVSGLRIKINDLYAAPKVSNELINMLSARYLISNWTQQYATFFKAIRMEKTMMFIILLFIIAIAAFNLVASLVMTVTDKQSDIAILRTLGASPKTIMSIFVLQGAYIGFIGTFLGVVGGILLALNAPHIVSWLENVFHTHFISASIYWVNYLPSKLDWHYIVSVSVIALLMSFVATLYPAWRASRVQPAEALRYE